MSSKIIFYKEFEYCYNGTSGPFSFYALYGGGTAEEGGGPVMLLDISATWCGPCFNAITDVLDPLHEIFGDDLMIVTALSDLNQPYSCEEWGNRSNPDGSGYHDIFEDVGMYGLSENPEEEITLATYFFMADFKETMFSR